MVNIFSANNVHIYIKCVHCVKWSMVGGVGEESWAGGPGFTIHYTKKLYLNIGVVHGLQACGLPSCADGVWWGGVGWSGEGWVSLPSV